MIPTNVFREYDIRGTVGSELTAENVFAIGRAVGTYLRSRGKTLSLLARDNRPSSEEFAYIIRDALLASGIDVLDLGLAPTPAFYYGAQHYAAGQGGVMVTGSHNPPQFNGFKVICGRGTIYGDEIRAIGAIARSGEFARGRGAYSTRAVLADYRDALLARVNVPAPVSVVADAGNGTASLLIPEVLQAAGCDARGLFCELDGTFPNHWPDPTLPANMETLQSEVLRTGAGFGVAFDGDADRIGAVDDKGRIIWGDKLLALYAAPILAAHPGGKVIFEVKCSQALPERVAQLGGVPIMWKTGHSLIEAKIHEEGALLAGEMSGHIYFADRYFGYDDALYAALRLAELVAAAGRPLSALADEIPSYAASPEIRVDCPDEVKFTVVEQVSAHFRSRYPVIDVDGARIVFPAGWGLVRASNTQPALVLRFEAQTEEERDSIQSEVEAALNGIFQKLRIPREEET